MTLDDLASRGLEPELARALREPRCLTTSSTLAAADHRLGERPDHRVGAGAVAGQLGLEERAEEERVVGELEAPRRAVLVVGAEDDARLGRGSMKRGSIP